MGSPQEGESSKTLTVLTEYFHPEEASTAQLLTELATGLQQRYEFDVSVLTSHPNYHDEDRRMSVPRRETHEGVVIERLRSTRFDKDSIPLRVVNWITFTVLALVRLLCGHSDDDAVLVLSNPPILPLIAWVNHKIRGVPYVYLVYDVYPDMAVELGYLERNGIVARAWDRLMRPVYRDADRIIVLGDSMERHLTEKLEHDSDFKPGCIEVIPNWEDEDFIEPCKKETNDFAKENDTVDKFTLLYSGNIGRFHELETAIDAIAQLESRGRKDIQLLIIGEGARKEELQKEVRRRHIDNVRFLPFQPLEQLPETLTCGDASLVGIKPEMEGMCVSSKLYSSLAAGMPIMAVVGDGDEVARVVREYDCGSYVPPDDVETAADVLAEWADKPETVQDLGRNARECFEQRYTVDHALRQYAGLFDEVVGSN
ncbi:glycosyltransferase family 4 protein [Halopenitus persicus]|uniref:Glycosyltransferase involved in cell wall bisynthesis n=1 Tax=Halopenitus persicus TaxID=1048396 RepID=A0A1H3IZP9_9EURY|nr:glycosyltransferase family 4 protein [Halopenitus persicus]SDY33171.1 Glycosyltransferase involved in cell wall bisynthesis [Halopenitus persicus]